MGKAIILTDSDFSAFGLGVVTRVTEQILPSVAKIITATTFRVEKNGVVISPVSWAISDNTLASLVDNGDGTCTVTPLTLTTTPVTLTATYTEGEVSISFLATRDSFDITSFFAPYFLARKSIGALYQEISSTNNARCCIPATLFSTAGVDISNYSTIIVKIKSGFDYVFGTGPVPGTGTSWQGWNGSTGGQEFAWVTGNQEAIATIDNTVLAMSLNLRYDDNSTTFASGTVLTDVVESIILVA